MSVQVDPLIGQVIQNRYRIGKVLGAGGMGKVYLAQQLDLERPVAFKVLLPQFARDNEFLLRFRREARQLATLRDHSRVVDIYGSGELPDGGLFIVMEYVDGPTLQEVIKTTGPLPLGRAVALGMQIAEGLREAHRVNIVHRDIKPANIKVWEVAEGEAVKILDFGIAQAMNPETWMQITRKDVVIGSPTYMAPETIREGEYSERSDLYAWGVVLYEMVHGRPPFNAKTGEAVKYKHVHEPPKPLRELHPDVPVALERSVMQALEKDPAQRPANMQAVISALRTVDLTPTHEPTAPTIILNDQQPTVQKLQQVASPAPSSPLPRPKVEKKSEIPVTAHPPDPLSERRRRGIRMNLKWLGVVLALIGTGILVFTMFPVMREMNPVSKTESRPAPIESPLSAKPAPTPPTANDRNDETREEDARQQAEERTQREAAAERKAKEEAERQRRDDEQRRTGEMVSVPAGRFFMGCNEEVDTECDNDEKPGRQFSVDAFKIDKTEVTVEQFAQCVNDGTCSSQGLTMPYYKYKEQSEFSWACNWGKGGRESHPINCLDWNQAKTYCGWVGKRLPTEAEWEKAARGTDGRKYPWGNRGYGSAGQVANIGDETAKRSQPSWAIAEGYNDGFYGTAPVGSFPAGASPYGAFDMVGNVWEWTADWYNKEQKYRSGRGGGWSSQPRRARASHHDWGKPDIRGGDLGIRCAQ